MVIRKIKFLLLIALISLPLFSTDGQAENKVMEELDTVSISSDDDEVDQLSTIVSGTSLVKDFSYRISSEKFDQAFKIIYSNCICLNHLIKGIYDSLSINKNKTLTEKEWQNKIDTTCSDLVPENLKVLKEFDLMKMLLTWIIKPY